MRQPFSYLAEVNVTLRRVPQDVAEKARCANMTDPVGIFHARSKKLVAIMELKNLFDHNGMNFVND